eukprot:1532180-Rhodomonas_salina.5
MLSYRPTRSLPDVRYCHGRPALTDVPGASARYAAMLLRTYAYDPTPCSVLRQRMLLPGRGRARGGRCRESRRRSVTEQPTAT